MIHLIGINRIIYVIRVISKFDIFGSFALMWTYKGPKQIILTHTYHTFAVPLHTYCTYEIPLHTYHKYMLYLYTPTTHVLYLYTPTTPMQYFTWIPHLFSISIGLALHCTLNSPMMYMYLSMGLAHLLGTWTYLKSFFSRYWYMEADCGTSTEDME